VRQVVRGLSLLFFAPLIAGCGDVTISTPAPVTITIAGSTAMRPALQALTAEFSRRHPNVVFDLRGGGSSLGEEQARAGQATLGASTLLDRAAAPTGADAVPGAPGSAPPTPDRLRRIPIGVDGLAVVVHATNDIPSLTLLQLRDIYSGEVLDWVQLGGAEGEILLVSREEGSGTQRTFLDRVMGDEPMSLTAIVMPTGDDVVEYVGQNPQAIGYVSRAIVADLLHPPGTGTPTPTPAATGVRVVPVEGLMPTADNLLNQTYFLLQPLYLVSNGPPQGVARQFVDFALSPAGQEIVARFHAPLPR
jgi:phosphate transport system substrate-binding protein